MNIVFVLLPLSLLLGVVFLFAYCWSIKNGQMEDLETPALRIFGEDDLKK